jgi:hypothetical protein
MQHACLCRVGSEAATAPLSAGSMTCVDRRLMTRFLLPCAESRQRKLTLPSEKPTSLLWAIPTRWVYPCCARVGMTAATALSMKT